jgi:nitroreductase
MNQLPNLAMHASLNLHRGPVEPWEISETDFPHDGTTQQKWRFLLGYALLAPSSHNSQPWLFRICGNQLELYADRMRACHVVDPNDRELIISCGCALFHLRTALAHFAYFGRVDLLPDQNDPDLLARLSLGIHEGTSRGEGDLFRAIPMRRTNRQPFRDEPIPPALVSAMKGAAQDESAWLHVLTSEQERQSLASLIAEGDRRQWANKRFRLELAAWVHSNRSSARDGIPGYAQGVDDLMSCAGPLVVRTFDMGAGQAAKDHELATGSPGLVVLGTNGDTPRDWLHAGQALARLLLRARVEDVWASFLNQPIELPDLRQRIGVSLGLTGVPQACLRLGFGEDIKPTPRRDVDEVLV